MNDEVFCVFCGVKKHSVKAGYFSPKTGKPEYKLACSNVKCKRHCIETYGGCRMVVTKKSWFGNPQEYKCSVCGEVSYPEMR